MITEQSQQYVFQNSSDLVTRNSFIAKLYGLVSCHTLKVRKAILGKDLIPWSSNIRLGQYLALKFLTKASLIDDPDMTLIKQLSFSSIPFHPFNVWGKRLDIGK